MAVNMPLDDAWTTDFQTLPKGRGAEAHSFDLAPSGQFSEITNRLVDEMIARWKSGDRPAAEEFLQRHPELYTEPESAVHLIYEEVCLRHEHGEGVIADEIMRRFPQWRTELRILLDCHDLLGIAKSKLPAMPGSGESFGDFMLLSELGKGAQGRVFLARHKSLANRLMVLKITESAGHEHLSLARLQHTHIVPLYSVEDWPERRLQALVFPYLGRVTWKQLLIHLHSVPLQARQGKHILGVLDAAEADGLSTQAPPSRARQLLARESYVQAICRMGATLAQALHYAHERGLVHLDIKPSNVLLAQDGEPLLLDFHLAQAPLTPTSARPENLGGTRGYMAPEQAQAMPAVKEGRPVDVPVDGRADLYALGVVLYEALGGRLGKPGEALQPLATFNPAVSVGLSDIVQKCLSANPRDRYADGAALAEDLRRHVEDLPLRGVANRSIAERWRKWRRRRPYLLPVAILALALLGAVGTVGALWANQRHERYRTAERSLEQGRALMHQHRYADAVRTLKQGEELIAQQAPNSPLAKSLATHARTAQRAKSAQELHFHVEMLRFFYLSENLPPRVVFIMEAHGKKLWNDRKTLLDRQQGPLEMQVEETMKNDLLDLAICLADFRVRLCKGDDANAMRHTALKDLQDAEATFGPSAAIFHERRRYANDLGLTDLAMEAERQVATAKLQTAWDQFTVGRGLMRAGKYEEASKHLALAQKQSDKAGKELLPFFMMKPQRFWTNFCLGVCANKLAKYEDAVVAFSVGIGQFPQYPECYVQRGIAHAALGNYDRAHADYSYALELQPEHAEAYLQRGILECENDRVDVGLADLTRARDLGVDQATVHYRLAVGRWVQKDRAGALDDVRTALKYRPDFRPARNLQDRILKTP